MIGMLLDRAHRLQGSDVEDVVVERRADPRGIEISTAGQHRERTATQRCERVVEGGGSQIIRHHGSLDSLPMIPERSERPHRGGRRSPPSGEAHLAVGAHDLLQPDGEGGRAQIFDRLRRPHRLPHRAVGLAHGVFQAGLHQVELVHAA